MRRYAVLHFLRAALLFSLGPIWNLTSVVANLPSLPDSMMVSFGETADSTTSSPTESWNTTDSTRSFENKDGTAGLPPGTTVYGNIANPPPVFAAPGVGVFHADDLRLIIVAGCELVYYEIAVIGGGGGPFDARVELFDGDPCDGGMSVAGTIREWFSVADDGFSHLLSAEFSPAIDIPGDVWMKVSFSTDQAAWLLAGEAEIGSTENFFSTDDPDFGECERLGFGKNLHAGYWASLRCDLGPNVIGACCDGPFCSETEEVDCLGQWRGPATSCEINLCESSFLIYENDFVTGFFAGIDAGTLWADDVSPAAGTAPCDLAAYEVAMTGAGASTFDAFVELWTNDAGTDGIISSDDRPLAPIPGTRTEFQNVPADQMTHWLKTEQFPEEITLPEKFWIVYSTSTPTSGPLGGGLATIGSSDDAFAIFVGNWTIGFNFGGFNPTGCPGPFPCNPAGSFLSRVHCYGSAPTGACCGRFSGACQDGVTLADCDGRWVQEASCAADPFEPDCGTHACCRRDSQNPDMTICDELTVADCTDSSGESAPGEFCDNHDCGTAACIGAAGECSKPHATPGCLVDSCCNVVCGHDPFCCNMGWDAHCVTLAAEHCPPPPPINDRCADFLEVTVGQTPFSTEHAMTDGLSLPQQCDDGFGVAFGNDVWFRFTAVETGELTVDLCTATDYDARLAVYRDCSCPPAQIADCDDDGCGVVGRGSRVRISVTEGNCYTIRVGGFGEVSGSGILLLSLESSACPPGKVEFVQPPPEVVDARQPHPINATVPRQGIDSIVVQGPPGAPASCWQLCESADTGKANAIQSAVENPLGTYTLTLDRVITPVAATSIVYLGSGDRATYYSHPGNVNGDSAAAVLDVLAIIDCLNGVNMAISCPWGFPFSQDLDHSGGFGPADILREIDLLNGADALEPANGTVIPIAVDCP